MVRSILTLTYRKSGKVKTVWEMDCLQSPPAEASWSFRHVVPSRQLHYPMVPGLDQFDSTRWIQMNPKPFEEKVLKSVIRVVSPASLSQERSCRPQRSPGKGVPYSSATSSSLHEHLDDFNGFKMRMWNYGVMWNELICCSFRHASCVPLKKWGFWMVCAKGDWNLWQASVILMTLDCAKIVWQLALLCFICIAIPLCYISLDLTAEIPAQNEG